MKRLRDKVNELFNFAIDNPIETLSAGISVLAISAVAFFDVGFVEGFAHRESPEVSCPVVPGPIGQTIGKVTCQLETAGYDLSGHPGNR